MHVTGNRVCSTKKLTLYSLVDLLAYPHMISLSGTLEVGLLLFLFLSSLGFGSHCAYHSVVPVPDHAPADKGLR